MWAVTLNLVHFPYTAANEGPTLENIDKSQSFYKIFSELVTNFKEENKKFIAVYHYEML